MHISVSLWMPNARTVLNLANRAILEDCLFRNLCRVCITTVRSVKNYDYCKLQYRRTLINSKILSNFLCKNDAPTAKSGLWE